MNIGIGMKAVVKHDRRYRGTIDGISIQYDVLSYRINDHWWFADQLEAL